MLDKNTKISQKELQEIISSLESIRGWGSVEIFMQNFQITQITEKNIKKPTRSAQAEE